VWDNVADAWWCWKCKKHFTDDDLKNRRAA
jgi:hypothetical protein